ADRGRLAPGEVVGAPGAGRRERCDDALGQVLDVDERALLLAGAGDRERLARSSARDEARDDGGGPGARAVRDTEAHDRRFDPVELGVGAAVELPGQLAGRVEVRGRGQERVLVDL